MSARVEGNIVTKVCSAIGLDAEEDASHTGLNEIARLDIDVVGQRES